MGCFLLICLSGLYLEGGVGYIDPVRVPVAAPTWYGHRMWWWYDANNTANPMGRMAIGHEWNPTPHARISFEIRHESWIGTSLDRGQNSAWVSVRVKPWAKD